MPQTCKDDLRANDRELDVGSADTQRKSCGARGCSTLRRMYVLDALRWAGGGVSGALPVARVFWGGGPTSYLSSVV